jgi:anti-anti-sigma factor
MQGDHFSHSDDEARSGPRRAKPVSMKLDDVIIVEPQGRLDALGARDLWGCLEPLTGAQNVHMVIDLGGTRYVSSDGLRILLRALKAYRRNGGGLKLCCLNPRLSEIIAMAGLDRIFEIYPTRTAALQAFEETGSGPAAKE